MYHRATFAEVTPNYIEQLKSGSTGAMKAGPSEAKKSGSTTVDVPAGWVRLEHSIHTCIEFH